ncbi:MAG: hypothetical protein J6U54_03480 [Clostridiales bacterium]|nr:hypothetical protein [Clostridiales bacterium]
MGKVTQTELSKRSRFWIPKNRYYELKYFCLQYWDWQRRRAELDGIATRERREPTESEAIEKAELDAKIRDVLTTCETAGGFVSLELLTGVTKGLSYDVMNTRHLVPVGREAYYVIYRKFFWMLDHARK